MPKYTHRPPCAGSTFFPLQTEATWPTSRPLTTSVSDCSSVFSNVKKVVPEGMRAHAPRAYRSQCGPPRRARVLRGCRAGPRWSRSMTLARVQATRWLDRCPVGELLRFAVRQHWSTRCTRRRCRHAPLACGALPESQPLRSTWPPPSGQTESEEGPFPLDWRRCHRRRRQQKQRADTARKLGA
eukprot:scaffold911_cov361-Prasinococcus_capsulatus_cf.AAC.8